MYVYNFFFYEYMVCICHSHAHFIYVYVIPCLCYHRQSNPINRQPSALPRRNRLCDKAAQCTTIVLFCTVASIFVRNKVMLFYFVISHRKIVCIL